MGFTLLSSGFSIVLLVNLNLSPKYIKFNIVEKD